MSRIRPQLLIGGQDARAALDAAGVTAVISLGLPPAPAPAGLPSLLIEAEDSEETDILSRLPEAAIYAEHASFLLRARRETSVLTGVSRSATVVAAVLMATESLPAETALEHIAAAHPAADPNAGFRAQLELFGQMGCKLDASYGPYRRFCAAAAAEARAAGAETRGLEVTATAADPGLASAGPAVLGAADGTVRCRKCRRLLAADEHIVSHSVGRGQAAFDPWRRGGSGGTGGTTQACSSLFTEPMAWMAGIDGGEVEGKLSCPKCATRLGTYCWAGAQCSCGAWVTPAFQLHVSKLDVALARPQGDGGYGAPAGQFLVAMPRR